MEQGDRRMALGADTPGVIRMDPAASDGRHTLAAAHDSATPADDCRNRGTTEKLLPESALTDGTGVGYVALADGSVADRLVVEAEVEVEAAGPAWRLSA